MESHSARRAVYICEIGWVGTCRRVWIVDYDDDYDDEHDYDDDYEHEHEHDDEHEREHEIRGDISLYSGILPVVY